MGAVSSVTSWRQAAVTSAWRCSASSIRDALRGILRDGSYASMDGSSCLSKRDVFRERAYCVRARERGGSTTNHKVGSLRTAAQVCLC